MRRVFAATAALAALSLSFPAAAPSAVGTAGTRPPRRVPAPPVHRSVPPTADTLPAGTAPPSPSPEEAVPAGDTVWDQLAACESNGDWHISTGNGYSGGLQWHPDTWRRAGGTNYAPTAHEATREQEIAVAETWLAKTSWEQWPACSKLLGLRP